MDKKISFFEYIYKNTKMSLVWLVIRVYVGWVWLEAALAKIGNPVWTGSKSGVALTGFLNNALQKTATR